MSAVGSNDEISLPAVRHIHACLSQSEQSHDFPPIESEGKSKECLAGNILTVQVL